MNENVLKGETNADMHTLGIYSLRGRVFPEFEDFFSELGRAARKASASELQKKGKRTISVNKSDLS